MALTKAYPYALVEDLPKMRERKRDILLMIGRNRFDLIKKEFQSDPFDVDGDIICEAVINSNLEILTWCFENTSEETIEEIGKVGDVFYPMFLAVEHGSLEIFKYLFDQNMIRFDFGIIIRTCFVFNRKDIYDFLISSFRYSMKSCFTPGFLSQLWNGRRERLAWIAEFPVRGKEEKFEASVRALTKNTKIVDCILEARKTFLVKLEGKKKLIPHTLFSKTMRG